jgi:mRNA interferase MazF
MTIKQGDVYWAHLGFPQESEPGYHHPVVVVQNDVFNASRINTVVVYVITSNLKRAKAPGNVVLNKGEANLQKKCVVNISQVATVNKSKLKNKIGTLDSEMIQEIIDGIKLLIEPLAVPDN